MLPLGRRAKRLLSSYYLPLNRRLSGWQQRVESVSLSASEADVHRYSVLL